ncbi:MAG: SPOR domain-containing protein [Ramlibacter sp.]
MALFKSRKAGDDAATAPRQPESVEAMRKRARHRLIGAGVLVLIGVIGFPLLFDTQPRPIAVDIPIDIPDRDKAKPLQPPAKPATQAPAVSGPVTAAPANAQASAAQAKDAAAAPAAPQPRAEAAPVAKVEPKPEPKPEPKAAAKPEVKVAEATKAKGLLEAKPVAAAPAAGRYVVQVGAFADAAKAREVRAKVERAGLKTYTHVAETKDGKRIRVRVGPFETRSEADKAASKLKGLDMPAAILTL